MNRVDPPGSVTSPVCQADLHERRLTIGNGEAPALRHKLRI